MTAELTVEQISKMIDTILGAAKADAIINNKYVNLPDLFFRLAFMDTDDLTEIYNNIIQKG